MPEPLRLLAVVAHPDDEALAIGGTVTRYAAQGIAVDAIVATRGERGWTGTPANYPGPEALGRQREAELRCAATELGLREVILLGYMDGEVDQADPAAATRRIAGHVRRLRPQVVVTFGPDGAYGHPDHIAISQLTTAALVCAADSSYTAEGDRPPHRVAKLYYRAWTLDEHAAYQTIFGEIMMKVDGVERRLVGWNEWMMSARIDTAEYWPAVWRAVNCHTSQMPANKQLGHLPPELHKKLWGCQGYYRAYSTVNGGGTRETDLFAGLR